MKKITTAKILGVIFLNVLLVGCDGYGGQDVTGDGQPDGVRPQNGLCPPYSDADKPHADGYCYPG